MSGINNVRSFVYSDILESGGFQYSGFAGGIALALLADTVTEEGTDDKIFFRTKAVEGTVDDQSDGLYTFFFAEKEVDIAIPEFLFKKEIFSRWRRFIAKSASAVFRVHSAMFLTPFCSS